MNFSGISKSSFMGQVLRWPLGLIPDSACIPILQGPARGQWWIVGAGVHGYWLGSYEQPKSRQFVRGLRMGDVVYDVGANVGYYTLLAAAVTGKCGRVIAFEPLPENLSYLLRHLSLNRTQNVHVIAAAVSDHAGQAQFEVAPSRSMGQVSERGKLPIRLVALDELVASGQIPPPNCMKIDVEGAELQVLSGARNVLTQARPDIYLATHGREMHRGCCQVLADAGYRLQAMNGQSVDQTDEIYATQR